MNDFGPSLNEGMWRLTTIFTILSVVIGGGVIGYCIYVVCTSVK